MASSIREATVSDLDGILGLAERKREEYERYQPVFWRRAREARSVQERSFRKLLDAGSALVLVAESDGRLEGFLIADIRHAPPVYEPGGKTCLIDDFAVVSADRWPTVGRALMTEATARARERGAVQIVVVCGHQDEPKRRALAAAGYSIASEWHVAPISDD